MIRHTPANGLVIMSSGTGSIQQKLCDLKEIGGPKVKFDDAPGWLVAYDYSFSGLQSGGVVLGVRYLWIDYDVDKVNSMRASGVEIDGNHVGVHIDYMF